ncbi:MFS transporter [Dyella silvatica]|uniref:MFS transporter n=1 Tax=Dyella silvatica TaxID=2992128 RepID=UPI0022571F84|nr:MFS transporter [Dyella silvatica]
MNASLRTGQRGMPRSTVMMFAVASGLSVANVYYAQPLLDAIAGDFHISHASVGMVMTATQIGSALALIFVVPLGDLLDRRRLMLVQLAWLALALISLCFASSKPLLLAGMLAVGMLGTAMTQGLIAFAATMATPSERGRVVGAAQGGVVIGLLLARTLAGWLTDLAGWRSVYAVSGLLAVLMIAVLARMLPSQQASQTPLAYLPLLRSMFALLRHERVLQIRGVIAMLMFAAFSVFWTSLVFPLGAPPYSYSHTMIGSFGLVGAIGALAAARAGQLADRGLGQWVTGAALLLLLASWLPIAFTSHALWALIVGVIALDLGGQAIHVVNQSMIFRVRPEAHSRLVGCYMMFYAVGSGAGAISSTMVYAYAGWNGVCLLGAAISALACVFWLGSKQLMPGGWSSSRSIAG